MRRFNQITVGSIIAAAIALSASAVFAASLQRLSPENGLGRIEFKHLETNASGDFVGVTPTKVFVGNAADGTLQEILATERTNFVLENSASFNVSSPDNTSVQQVMIDAELLGSRLDLNANGDFVLASNTLLWIGNARTKTVRKVADAGTYADFQQVRINDAGQYVATSATKIYGGHVDAEQATLILEKAFGNFGVLDVSALAPNAQVSTGEERLAINARGQFVAITHSAVYAGDLSAPAPVALLHQAQGIGFRHVSLQDSGRFVIVSLKDVFAGSF